MMLGLLLVRAPHHVAVLGLGAGSLVNALLSLSEVAAVTAVELRQQVVAVARQWFDFSPDARLQLVVADAEQFLAEAQGGYQLLLADLYTDEGMVPCQQSPRFLANCCHNLTDDGVLVLNLWGSEGALPAVLRRELERWFEGGLWLCPVDEGNVILFALKGRSPSPRRLLHPARRYGKRLGFSLQPFLGRLRPLA